MTAKNVLNISFSEIGKVEITCKCGAAFIFPVPQEKGQKYPPTPYTCLGCGIELWNGIHDERYSRVYKLIESLALWQTLKSKEFDLSFSLNSN
jgi:hypothetical protein